MPASKAYIYPYNDYCKRGAAHTCPFGASGALATCALLWTLPLARRAPCGYAGSRGLRARFTVAALTVVRTSKALFTALLGTGHAPHNTVPHTRFSLFVSHTSAHTVDAEANSRQARQQAAALTLSGARSGRSPPTTRSPPPMGPHRLRDPLRLSPASSSSSARFERFCRSAGTHGSVAHKGVVRPPAAWLTLPAAASLRRAMGPRQRIEPRGYGK